MKKVIVAIITCLLIITYMMPVNTFAFNNSDKVILIDPGHGGIDGGAKSKAGTIEKDINLQISLKLRDNLDTICSVIDFAKVEVMRHSNKFAINKRTKNKEVCPSPTAYLCSTYTDDYRNQDSKRLSDLSTLRLHLSMQTVTSILNQSRLMPRCCRRTDSRAFSSTVRRAKAICSPPRSACCLPSVGCR